METLLFLLSNSSSSKTTVAAVDEHTEEDACDEVVSGPSRISPKIMRKLLRHFTGKESLRCVRYWLTNTLIWHLQDYPLLYYYMLKPTAKD